MALPREANFHNTIHVADDTPERMQRIDRVERVAVVHEQIPLAKEARARPPYTGSFADLIAARFDASAWSCPLRFDAEY